MLKLKIADLPPGYSRCTTWKWEFPATMYVHQIRPDLVVNVHTQDLWRATTITCREVGRRID